jgi:O-antigen ligase/tetratricopeptide (TPR) repeat protein
MVVNRTLFLLILGIVLLPFFVPLKIGDWEFGSIPTHLHIAWSSVTLLGVLLIWIIDNYQNKQHLALRKSEFYMPIVLFAAWSCFSLLWSHNLYLGTTTVIQYGLTALGFLLVYNIFRSPESIIKLLNYLIFSLLLISIIGLSQYYFPDIEWIQLFFPQTAGPASVFTNRNLASHFVVLLLPLSFILLIYCQNLKRLYFYSFTTFVAMLFLIFITAKQAYLAVFVELIVLIIFLLLDHYKNKSAFIKSINFGKVKLFAIISIMLMVATVSNIDKHGLTFDSGSKVERLTNTTATSANARFPAWLNTIAMFKDNPILGVGVGQWSEVYPLYYDAIAKDTGFGDVTKFIKPHNEYLSLLSTTGLVGFSLLIWLFVVSAKSSWLVLADANNQSRYLSLALTLGLTGFAVVAFFSFPIKSFVTGFVAMVFVALLASLATNKVNTVFNLNKIKYFGLLSLFSVVMAIIAYYSYHVVKASQIKNSAVVAFNNGKIDDAIRQSKDFIFHNPFDHAYYNSAALFLMEDRANLANIRKSIPLLKKAIKLSVFKAEYLFNLHIAYRIVGDMDNAIIILRKILKHDSRHIKATAALVRLLFAKADYDEANPLYKHLKINFEYFKNRRNFGPYHTVLSKLAFDVRDYKYASYIYSDLVAREPSAQRYVVYAIIELQHLGNKKKAKSLFLKAIELDAAIEIPEEIKQDLKL